MNEQTKTIIAASFELGLPLLVLVAAICLPKIRKWAAVVLGALTPLLLSYVMTSVRAVILKEEDAIWAFNGMWIISLYQFVGCAVFGAALGMIPTSHGKTMRFIFGLVIPAILAIIWANFISHD